MYTKLVWVRYPFFLGIRVDPRKPPKKSAILKYKKKKTSSFLLYTSSIVAV